MEKNSTKICEEKKATKILSYSRTGHQLSVFREWNCVWNESNLLFFNNFLYCSMPKII